MTTILPKTETVRLERLDCEVTLYDLPVWYIDKVRENTEADTAEAAILAASSLTEERLKQLGSSEQGVLYAHIVRLTFGDEPPKEEHSDGGKH